MPQYASYSGYGSGSGGGGSGTVTSVGLAVPTGFTVSGSPVTSSGTITIGLSTELANTVWAGPTTGAASAPSFRALVASDIPTLPYLSTTLGTANGLSVSTNTLSLGLSSTSTTGALSSTDWNTFNGKQAALTLGNLTDAGTDGIVVTGGSGSVVGSGTSIAQHVADSTHNGYLSSTDWSTFNSKQASGNYITALTGDATASGPGSVALTLATVNSNVGSFGSSTSIPSLTVNAKGLVTAASGNVVIAPAGTLTGTTLASNVVTSSLTSVGTISSGTWAGTTVSVDHGGTGLATLTANNVILGNGTSAPNFVAPSGSGNVLTSNGTTWVSSPPAGSSSIGFVVAAHIDSFPSQWARASNTYGAFSSNGSATDNVLDITTSTFGTPQTTANQLPQITVNSLVDGIYKVTASFTADDTASTFCGYAINDTITTSGQATGQTVSQESIVTIIGIFQYGSTANRTFSLWGFANSGSVEIDMGATNAQLNWIIEKVG